jgi:hypothetical protein
MMDCTVTSHAANVDLLRPAVPAAAFKAYRWRRRRMRMVENREGLVGRRKRGDGKKADRSTKRVTEEGVCTEYRSNHRACVDR